MLTSSKITLNSIIGQYLLVSNSNFKTFLCKYSFYLEFMSIEEHTHKSFIIFYIKKSI